MDPEAVEGLLNRAAGAMELALAQCSGFRVGAALLAAGGRVYTGCNIENPSLMLTLCAERVALYKAISEGARSFEAIAIVCSEDRPCAPCGPCRQALHEFAPGIQVYLRSSAGVVKYTEAELLPNPFDR